MTRGNTKVSGFWEKANKKSEEVRSRPDWKKCSILEEYYCSYYTIFTKKKDKEEKK